MAPVKKLSRGLGSGRVALKLARSINQNPSLAGELHKPRLALAVVAQILGPEFILNMRPTHPIDIRAARHLVRLYGVPWVKSPFTSPSELQDAREQFSDLTLSEARVRLAELESGRPLKKYPDDNVSQIVTNLALFFYSHQTKSLRECRASCDALPFWGEKNTVFNLPAAVLLRRMTSKVQGKRISQEKLAEEFGLSIQYVRFWLDTMLSSNRFLSRYSSSLVRQAFYSAWIEFGDALLEGTPLISRTMRRWKIHYQEKTDFSITVPDKIM